MIDTADILCKRLEGRAGVIAKITLNRVKALNALSLPMIETLARSIKEFEQDPAVKAIVIASNSEKAFCAGGDVRALYHEKLAGENIERFFRHEYRLNYAISQLKTPYISLLDGMTMGGGVGISLHGSHPVASENFSFAMPETTIGFFPDVGGSHVLAKAPTGMANYLGLTGNRIGCDDALKANLISHSVESRRFGELLEALLESTWEQDAHHEVERLLASMQREHDEGELKHRETVLSDCFDVVSVEEVFKHLEQSSDDWSQQTLTSLLSKSPTSLKVTFEQLKRARSLDLGECLQMDYRMVNRFITQADFFEGVRALLVDKDKSPQWTPKSLSEVSLAELEKYFTPLEQELSFL